jgi:ABC-type transport system involved in Fe-S cluster assembly fused permease/ATPase subunit
MIEVLFCCVVHFVPVFPGTVTGGVICIYFIFTLTTTDWRDRYRRVMNEKGQLRGSKLALQSRRTILGRSRSPCLLALVCR